MDDATIGNICETISTWGGASASGLSASANLVVEKLEAGLAAQTAAVNESRRLECNSGCHCHCTK